MISRVFSKHTRFFYKNGVILFHQMNILNFLVKNHIFKKILKVNAK